MLRAVPGVAGAWCAVAGAYLLAGTAVALLAAAGFLLLADWRLSR